MYVYGCCGGQGLKTTQAVTIWIKKNPLTMQLVKSKNTVNNFSIDSRNGTVSEKYDFLSNSCDCITPRESLKEMEKIVDEQKGMVLIYHPTIGATTKSEMKDS